MHLKCVAQLLHYLAKSKLLILFFCKHNKCKCSYFGHVNAAVFTHLIFMDVGPWHQNKWSVLYNLSGRAAGTGDVAHIRVISGDSFSAGQCTHRQIGPVRRSRYCSERFRLSLFQICGLPTAPNSTLLTTRCGVRCRTTFIRRRCETLTI